MSGTVAAPVEWGAPVPSTEELRGVLSAAIERRRPGVHVVDMGRAPSACGSSWWLEEITLELSDHTRPTLIFKDLVREIDGSGARDVKPAFVADPTREPWVYQNILKDTVGPPALWAAVGDRTINRHWLFVERVDGAPLAQIGDRHAWRAAAEWLGAFHAMASVQRAVRGPLLRHTAAYHRLWFERALAVAQTKARTSDIAREHMVRLRALESAHLRAISKALSMGTAVIHGEFYASNVLAERQGQSYVVHPVDWEMAALGPPSMDLAALMSGRWSNDDRIAMATAYRDAARSAGAHCPTLDELLLDVMACRMLLAVQWLGWSAEWIAPADHRNDWLEEAELCASELRG